MTTIMSVEASMNEQTEHASIWVAKLFAFPDGAKEAVVVFTFTCRIMKVEWTKMAKKSPRIPLAQGIVVVCTNLLFWVFGTTFSEKHLLCHKYICITLGADPLGCIGKSIRSEGLKVTVELNVVHYKEVEDWKTQKDGHMNVKTMSKWRKTEKKRST